jgi:hypothetical protein
MGLSDQDLTTIINLLLVVVFVILFPPGGGTPRRIPIPWIRKKMAAEPVYRVRARRRAF